MLACRLQRNQQSESSHEEEHAFGECAAFVTRCAICMLMCMLTGRYAIGGACPVEVVT